MLSPGNGENTTVAERAPGGNGVAGICDRVAELTDSQLIREFCEFIVAGLEGRALPDYDNIDLMQVPRLAPHVFVHDYRGGTEQGMLVKFSGTALDEHYGRVLQGRYIEENYTGSDGPDLYFPLHRRAIAERRPFLARRAILFDAGKPAERFKRSTVLYFPCSSDGETVNYGIGAVCIEPADREAEPLYLIL